MWIRGCLAAIALCCSQIVAADSQPADPPAEARSAILVIGDSLSAEYGLRRDTGWVKLIADRLRTEAPGYQILNSSISGDTTSGGRARLPAALSTHQPRVVIIELGSNDALRGLALVATRDNLSAMIEQARSRNAEVLLVGMQIPPNYGRAYTEQFQRLFSELAARHGVELVPFLLEGMAANMELFQADGIHPNEAAQAILADNVWKKLGPMLAR
ncbi:MAG: arylesterase [Alcaligenaceae bacterium]|nr:arylesterase [Alcaligenaceae bacterium]